MISRKKAIITLIFFMLFTMEVFTENNETITINYDLRIKSISENVWVHISDIEMPQWGRVSANGMVVLTDENLIIIDTPWNDRQTQNLVHWFKDNHEFNKIIVIVSHYHEDNLGGLNWVHRNGIESYSLKKTQEICKAKKLPIPENSLDKSHIFDFKEIIIEFHFPGEGHTVDSSIVYLPDEKILFGGCSVKALSNKGLGNTADANTSEWPETLRKIKSTFPEVRIVIPGHGNEGDISLIDHTLSLF